MKRSEPRVFYLDPEHAGLRLVVVLILFFSLWLSYFLARWLFRIFVPALDSPSLLACLGALPLSLLLGWFAEKFLKRTWHSGRQLVLTEERLRLERPRLPDEVLALDQPLQQLWWTFSLSGYPRGGRERRLPANWRCVAGQLRQDEARIIPYCFVPAPRVETWQAQYDIELLQPQDIYDNSLTARLSGPARPELPAEIVAGDQGRYWLAERNRWQDGVELMPDDFESLLGAIAEYATDGRNKERR